MKKEKERKEESEHLLHSLHRPAIKILFQSMLSCQAISYSE